MHHRVNIVIPLRQGRKLERSFLSRSARTPCDIDCKRFKIGQTGDAQEEIIEALCMIGH